MRYSVVLTGLSVSEAEARVRGVGGTNIKSMPAMGQLFCDMEPDQAARLAGVQGIRVSEVGRVSHKQIVSVPNMEFGIEEFGQEEASLIPQLEESPLLIEDGIVRSPTIPEATVLPAQEGLNLYTIYSGLRSGYLPALLGEGLTVAVLDSGIRKTHKALIDKVVYEANFSESSSLSDIFGHGTGIAYIIAGEDVEKQKSGISPAAKIMNIKVLNDDGEGTEESVVDGIDEVCRLVSAAIDEGLSPIDPMYPNTINLSLGGEDTGNPNSPMRVAARAAVNNYGLQMIAAAGNGGPNLGTITSPACEPLIMAVGGLKTWEFTVWETSSRGPSNEGRIKPDMVCWAEAIEVATHRNDTDYDSKTGTSFAAAIISGVDGLIWELTRRVYGENIRVLYSDWLQYPRAYFVKPRDAPIDKDNSYGYGIPALGSMVQQVMRPTSPISSLQTMLPAMMMMVMMTGMMKGLV